MLHLCTKLSSELGNCIVCNWFKVQTLLWLLEFVLHKKKLGMTPSKFKEEKCIKLDVS